MAKATPENGEKQRLISKKATLHVQHTFFVQIFAVVLHDCNVKLLSYTFFSFTIFSLLLIFTLHWWPLAFLILSPPLQNSHVVRPTKRCFLCFLSLALDISVALFLAELRWPAAYFLFFAVFLLLYIPNLWTRQLI